MSMKNALLALMVIAGTGIISACLDDADAQSGGVTRAEYQAVLDRLTALEANQPGDKVFAGGTSGSFAKAARAGSREIGTAVGFLPVNAPAHRSLSFVLKSPSGFLYSVFNDNRSSTGVIAINGLGEDGSITPLYFAAADCSGQGFVSSQHLTDYGASQGIVFRLHDGALNEVSDNPAQYFYVAIDTSRVNNIAYQSKTDNISKCTAESATLLWGYPALPNDAATTGVESAPIDIPITIS